MAQPLVSVVIPVGPRHQDVVRQAVASVLRQTYPAVEVVVVNDAPTVLCMWDDPRVRVIETGGGQRSAAARNRGLADARGDYVVWLDADDYLLSGAVANLLRAHAHHTACYTYSDFYGVSGASGRRMRVPDYDQASYAVFNLHPITALVPTHLARAVGGFDERAEGWEDWTFWLRLAIAGSCGWRWPHPTFVYRDALGGNHQRDIAGGQALMDAVTRRYRTQQGAIPMAPCGCGGGRGALPDPLPPAQELPAMERMTLEYIGRSSGSVVVRSPHTNATYRYGRNSAVRFLDVQDADPQDRAWLLAMRGADGAPLFRVLPPDPPFEPAPVIEEIVIEPTPAIAIAAQPVETVQAEALAQKRRKR